MGCSSSKDVVAATPQAKEESPVKAEVKPTEFEKAEKSKEWVLQQEKEFSLKNTVKAEAAKKEAPVAGEEAESSDEAPINMSDFKKMTDE